MIAPIGSALEIENIGLELQGLALMPERRFSDFGLAQRFSLMK